MRLSISLFLFLVQNAYCDTYALIIGVADYKFRNSVSGDLAYAVSDAIHFEEFLTSNKGGSIQKKNIFFLSNENATDKNIREVLNTFKNLDKLDKVWIYFSGHGDTPGLVPYDYNQYLKNYLTFNDLKLYLKNCPAQTKICVIDACHAGDILKSAKNKLKTPNTSSNSTIALLLGASSKNNSIEAEKLKGGVFTYYLLAGLDGYADLNKDNKVTIKELYTYTFRMVKGLTQTQKPAFFGKFSDNLILSEL